MKRILPALLVLGPGILLAGCSMYILSHQDAQTLRDLYENELRRSLFVAFLTLGGFLLSLKTFIVVKMKELVYDSDSFVADLYKMRQLTPGIEHYASLRRFSGLLFWAIISCFVVSLAQYTLGLSSPSWAPGACISGGVFAVYLLILSLVLTQCNLHDMFTHCEKASRKKYEDERQAEKARISAMQGVPTRRSP